MCHAFAFSSSLGLSSACLRNTISNMVLHARAGSRKLSGPNSANARSAVKNPVRVEKCFLFSSHWFTTITTNNAVMEKSTPVLSNESHCPISAPNTEPVIQYIWSNKEIKKISSFHSTLPVLSGCIKRNTSHPSKKMPYKGMLFPSP